MLNISSFTGGIAQTNGWLLQTENGAIAVDAPEGFADWLAKQKVKISALLITHQHFDHVQDAARIRREHGAPVFAYSPFSRELTLEALFGFATGTRFEIEAFQVDTLLEGKTVIEVGGLSWKLEHIPGHASDSIVFINEENHIAFCGDVVFQDSIGRCDFPGGDLKLLLRGIVEKLLPLPDDTILYPGHGAETTIGRERAENPYLE